MLLLSISCGPLLERSVSTPLISWFAQLCVSSMWTETSSCHQGVGDCTSQGSTDSAHSYHLGSRAVTESTSSCDEQSNVSRDRDVLATHHRCDHRPHSDGALLTHCVRLSYQVMSTSPTVLEAVIHLLSRMIVSPYLAGIII